MLTMHRRIRISLYVFITLSFLVATRAQAEVTYWRHNPATPGNWFAEPNWSAGVPGLEDRACIYNGGTAVIARGFAKAGQLNIGTVLQPASAEALKKVHPWPGTGAVRQIGGATRVKGGIYLSGSLRRPGSYTLKRGRLYARNIVVGRGLGSGRFYQSGGINRVEGELKVGDLLRSPSIKPSLKSSLGTYTLRRGRLVTGRTTVGAAGRGRFVQTGGVHRVKDLLAVGGPQPWSWLNPIPVAVDEVGEPVIVEGEIPEALLLPKVIISRPLPSKGLYVLRRGRLTARRQEIRRTGVMRQSGGSNKVAYMSVQRGGRYDYLGGRLRIDAGLDLDGKLNFGGRRTVLSASGALLNFSRGKVLKSQNAALLVGPRSLTIFAKDFNPKKEFRYFHTDGLVHFAGSDLVLAPRECFGGWGSIDDHVDSSGWIDATKGGGIDLRKGLFVHEGTVDLGEGKLTVRNNRSGIKDGRLFAGSMTIGGPLVANVTPVEIAPARFRQTGGRTTISRNLTVGRGMCKLERGSLSARTIEVGGSRLLGPNAEFVQTGGSCKADGVLRMGYYRLRRISVHNVPLVDAEATPLEIVDGPNGPIFVEVTPIPYPKATAVYKMSGGRLSAGSVRLYGRGGKTRFIQTGGAVDVRRELSVYGRGAGYAISDGRLRTQVLRIGSRYANSGGTLEILNRRARIEVSQRLSFGAGSRFAAVDGSTIHITGPRPETDQQWPGSTVENFSTNPKALAGLENLTLIFEGGDDYVATFEVACEDKGFDPSGLYDNFALDTLQIGGEDVAMVQLVDLFDNQSDSLDPEALYVRNFSIGAGSSLDTNGLALYCLNDGAIMQLIDVDLDGLIGRADLAALGYDGGGSPPPGVIPEPATLALLIIGGMGCLVRRRRN